MPSAQITAEDVSDWNSLEAIADCFESKKELKRREGLSDRDDELVLEIDDGEFMVLIESEPSKSASDYQSRTNARRRTNFVATSGYQSFTFTTRKRSFDEHGAIKFQQFSFEKDEIVSGSGKKFSKLEKINELEYGEPYNIYELYDTREVVDEFYEEFEDLRTDLIQEVSGIDENRGDAKERFVQVQLDRLLFLYFIQEKGLLDLNQSYLDDLHQSAVKSGEDVYESWFKPLFFDALGEGKRRQKLGNVPHLNGGLFSQSPIEGEFPEAKLGDSTEETNNLYREILDFLGDWNWHVDERLDIVDEKRISPEVLGHIFEQSVNQKEMGAYYTPEEITSFMAWNTVHPYLLDRLNEEVGESYKELDEVFGLDSEMDTVRNRAVADGGIAKTGTADSIQTDHVETLYFDILKEVSILDPAVGSGAFLLAVQEVLLDTYLSCIEHFRSLNPFERTGRVQNELEKIEERGNATLFTKYEIILNNLYGVDIDQGAVEICKLRLWLSTVADIENDPDDVEPLPNIDFNIRQGNSLIGFTGIQEIATNSGDASLTNYGGGIGRGVREMFEDVITAVNRHRSSESAKEAANARRTAESHIDNHSESLNKRVRDQFHEAGLNDLTIDDIEEYSPFHWVLEFATVYADGGFDVVVGNPPWDMLQPRRDEFFTRYDETFRTLPPNKKDQLEEELRENEKVQQAWDEYEESFKLRSQFFTEGSEYELQWGEIDGRTRTGRNDLSMLFLERTFDLTDDSGYVSQILPGKIFTNGTTKNLRVHLLENTEMNSVIGFENNGIFQGVHNQYSFGLLTFKNNGSTELFNGVFDQRSVDVLREFDQRSLKIPKEVVRDYSPEAVTFPFVRSQPELEALKNILQHPRLSDQSVDSWYADGHIEIYTRDSDYFSEARENADYPVYGGSNIYQFVHNSDFFGLEEPNYWSVKESVDSERSAKHRVREKSLPRLKREIYSSFGGDGTSKSKKKFVNDLLKQNRGEGLQLDDVKLDCTEYRIAFRNITNSTNERTFIATVLPPGIICYHALTTIRPYHINITEDDLNKNSLKSVYERAFTDEELFVLTGILNSIPFDFLMRTKVDTNISRYKFDESPVPRLNSGDDWFQHISQRAARLNCYGEEFEEMRERLGGVQPVLDEGERMKIQAEIDAGAFHVYGLEQKEVEYVIDDFHRVQNPRMMTESYFELVKEKYRDLQGS